MMTSTLFSTLALFPVAHAQSAPQGAPMGSPITQLIPVILLIVVAYFFLIRPTMKRQRKLRDQIKALKKGDRILTAGGIEGIVADLGDEQKMLVEIAEGVKVTIVKSTISGVYSEGIG